MVFTDKFDKNIGIFESETDSIKTTGWVSKLNLLDELWVPNTEMVDVCKESGVTVPIRVIPHTIDSEKYKQPYQPPNLPDCDDTFKFYFIGEFNRRKHLNALLRAFHTEFQSHEPVSLILKVNKPDKNEEQVSELVRETCTGVKNGLRLYKYSHMYHEEVIISQYLTEPQLLGLHKYADCFVNPSYGEAWCQPAMDAIGCNNAVISGAVGGPKDFVHPEYLVTGQYEPVFGADPLFEDLHTGWENWFSIDIMDLRRKMRKAYTHNLDITAYNDVVISSHCYGDVGESMKRIINA
jgi:glycosyltransferase involved in cell wall biosynthesis